MWYGAAHVLCTTLEGEVTEKRAKIVAFCCALAGCEFRPPAIFPPSPDQLTQEDLSGPMLDMASTDVGGSALPPPSHLMTLSWGANMGNISGITSIDTDALTLDGAVPPAGVAFAV